MSALTWQTGAPVPRWTPKVLLLSALCTAALFLAVPLLETLRSLDPASRTVRSLPLLPEPRPAVVPPPLVEAVEAEQTHTPLPQPAPPAPPVSRILPALPEFGAGPRLDLATGWAPRPLDLRSLPLSDWSSAGQAKVFELSDLDAPPRPISRMQPLYPQRARMLRKEGWVELIFVVTADGSVNDVQVSEAHPDETFSDAARRAVARWKFEPGRRHGAPVAVRVKQKLNFTLR